MTTVASLRDNLGGVYELTRLVLRTGFRLRSPYWRWRFETAFGTDPARRPGRLAQLRAMLEYGRWVRRIRTGRWQ